MSTFGDYEPEDAWDASDTLADDEHNLAERIALLDGGPEPSDPDPTVLLDIIHERIENVRRIRNVTGRDLLRLAQLLEDVRFARSRL